MVLFLTRRPEHRVVSSTEGPLPKPNYQRDKRQRDLTRQRKQEDKRLKRAMKDQVSSAATTDTEAIESTLDDYGTLENVEQP